MEKLLQFYTLPGSIIDKNDIADEIDGLACVLKDDKISFEKQTHDALLVPNMKGIITTYLCSDPVSDENCIIGHVSVRREDEFIGLKKERGFGAFGVGKHIETVQISGTDGLSERLEEEFESVFGEFGLGYLNGNGFDFDSKAKKNKEMNGHPLERADFILMALTLEYCKGPFADAEKIKSLETQKESCQLDLKNRGVYDSLKDSFKEAKGSYLILKQKFSKFRQKFE